MGVTYGVEVAAHEVRKGESGSEGDEKRPGIDDGDNNTREPIHENSRKRCSIIEGVGNTGHVEEGRRDTRRRPGSVTCLVLEGPENERRADGLRAARWRVGEDARRGG